MIEYLPIYYCLQVYYNVPSPPNVPMCILFVRIINKEFNSIGRLYNIVECNTEQDTIQYN